jgi:hypothetical protein
MISPTNSIDLNTIKAGLAGSGGYEVAHESPGLELGVYTLVAPEPDHQQPHADDEVYVVIDHPAVAELDLNPVLAFPDRCIAVDARVRVQRPEGRPRVKSW